MKEKLEEIKKIAVRKATRVCPNGDSKSFTIVRK